MKVGVIGAGYWGKKHINEFKELGHIIFVSDIDEKNLELYKNDSSIELTKDYTQLIHDSKIDAVTICAPNSLHYRIAKECLLGEKHVLVEKPISENLSEAEELIDIAMKKNLTLSVGHIFRFNNAIHTAKNMLKNGDLGEIRSIHIKWVNDEYSFQPDLHERIGDRDIITDLGVHAFDILTYLTGEYPDNIVGVGESFNMENKIEVINILGKLRKIIINIELSWITPPKTRLLTIIGEKQSLYIDCISQKIIAFKGEKKRTWI